ncbi:MAG TPA: DUF4271 domain-containing protein [Bacteroidia bacterium]|nr:DUF4271 domain-containing protein [Bacteroidia bacterium]
MADFAFILLQAAGIPANGFRPQPVISENENWWVAVMLFTSFTMLVVLRVFDHRRLLQLMNGFLRHSSVSILYREEYALTGRVSVLLLLNYLLVLPLFFWQVGRHYQMDVNGLVWFGFMSIGIGLAYFVKIVTVRVLGSVFEVRDAAAEYSYNILLFNKIGGLILFPVVLLLAYARQVPSGILIWAGLCILSIILIYRLLRIFLIGVSTPSVSLFYIILYLCTLEILPFIVIIKVFVDKFQQFSSPV